MTVAAGCDIEAARARERALQKCLLAWILGGLAFMLLPGTFLGVWNLIAIAGEHTASRVDPQWVQAHGHAQLFGWIGSFILGIGFYSLSKMGRLPQFAVRRAWLSWAMWTSGAALRWAAAVWSWHWRALLPASSVLEIAAFGLFFLTVRGHQPPAGAPAAQAKPVWMRLVIAGSVGFLASLAANLAAALYAAVSGATPSIPHDLNQKLLALFGWSFPVLTIWGFSARWLPVFLGMENPSPRLLTAALALDAAALGAAAAGRWSAAAALFIAASAAAAGGLRVFQRPLRPPKVEGVHPAFPIFVRMAYAWLLISGAVAGAASLWDAHGGFWGASRHALTVGFIAAMVFAIGQRVLPAFCGMKILYSPKLMFASLALLNAGCLLRVTSEIGAYESLAPALWPLLPVSAVIEMTAVTLFAANLVTTFAREPAHLANLRSGA